MISFTQATTLTGIEDSIAQLSTKPEPLVKVPTSLKHGGGFGIPTAFIQFFATWSRATKEQPTIKLHPAAALANGLEALAQEPHGMAALYFAPSVEDAAGQDVPTKHALGYAIPRIRSMQSGKYLDTMHGRGVFLSCFAGASNEYLLPFYSKGQSDSLRGREDFARLTEQVVNACAPNALRKFGARHMTALSNLVYELFRNTDEHAQTDENSNRYHRNMRGLIAKYVSISGESLSGDMAGDDAPQNFFILRNLANQAVHRNDEGRLRAKSDAAFLEITVFDTGPGLVKRWIAKNEPGIGIDQIDINQEVHFVQKCFEQYATTKDSSVSGHGLGLVLSSLKDLNAFLRLRTGRVCLIQDFSSAAVSAKFAPKHWMKNRTTLPYVAGASYSIFIPMSRGEN